jgi:hypothetical protein
LIVLPSVRKTFVGLATTALLAGTFGAASFGLAAVPAQAEPQFVPAYHWCPGDYFAPEWGPNWDPNVCHDDFNRDGYGYGGPPPPPEYAAPGNYYVPPGYNGPPPPPGGWVAPPFCIPFVNCPPGP